MGNGSGEGADKPARLTFSISVESLAIDESIQKLRKLKGKVSPEALDIFQSLFDVARPETHEIEVIRGDEFFDATRWTKDIRAEARRCRLKAPPAHLALFFALNHPHYHFVSNFVVFPHVPVRVQVAGKSPRPRILAIDTRYGRPDIVAPREISSDPWEDDRVFVFVKDEDAR